MQSTKIILLSLAAAATFAYCRKDLDYTLRRYDNTYLYGDSVNTWYPFKVVISHKKTVPTDTTPVYKTVAVFVNNNPDTSNFKITFRKQPDYDFLVNYEMPDSMANLMRVPKKGEVRLDKSNGSLEFGEKYVPHHTGDLFNDKTYTVYNKDSIIETEQVDLYFRE